MEKYYILIGFIIDYMKHSEKQGNTVGNYFLALSRFEKLHDICVEQILKGCGKDHTSLRHDVNRIYYKYHIEED